MKDLLEEISHTGNMFIRVHCSYVVNYYYIKSLSSTEAELLTGEKLPVSGEYENEALKKLDCILCRFVTSYDRTCYNLMQIIYVFLTIFLYLPKCPQSLILSALRAFCFCGKPRISRSIFLYFPCQSWLKSW